MPDNRCVECQESPCCCHEEFAPGYIESLPTMVDEREANRLVKHWQDCFSAMQAIKLEAQEILLELVRLKDHKDENGKTPEYERRQPEAWAKARAHVTEMMRDWTKDGGPSTYQPPASSITKSEEGSGHA